MINYVIIIVIIILLLLTVKKTNIKENIKENFNHIDETVHNDIYDILDIIHKLFTKYKITYWIMSGTLLGAIRHKKIIPWDDDADIGALLKDSSKIVNLKEELLENGYDICDFFGGYKIFKINGYIIPNYQWKFPFCDIFILNLKNNIYKCISEKAQEYWPDEYFKYNEIYPIRTIKFNNIYVNTINKPYPYLDRYFGNTWAIKGYEQYDHQLEKKKKRKIQILSEICDINYIWIFNSEYNHDLFLQYNDTYVVMFVNDNNINIFLDDISNNQDTNKQNILKRYKGIELIL